MIYNLSLHTVGLVLGLLLVVLHGLAIMHSEGAKKLLRAFPRSRQLGVILLTVDAIWAFLLVSKMDLGEFTQWRQWILTAIVAGYFLTLI